MIFQRKSNSTTLSVIIFASFDQFLVDSIIRPLMIINYLIFLCSSPRDADCCQVLTTLKIAGAPGPVCKNRIHD
jgi:hypothetical protein